MNYFMQYYLIISLFLAYFVLHSLMASIAVKQWVSDKWPNLMPFYRLFFNLLAIILCIPLALIMFLYPGEILWQWQGIGFVITSLMATLALIGFIVSLRYYDLSEFWGIRQLKEHNISVHDQEHFKISPFHRYVRHPWYFFAIVLIWTRDISSVQLLVYTLVTAYFLFGSRLEEKKLIVYHGEVYKRYQQKVSAVIPLPWKILSKQQAEQLLEKMQGDNHERNY